MSKNINLSDKVAFLGESIFFFEKCYKNNMFEKSCIFVNKCVGGSAVARPAAPNSLKKSEALKKVTFCNKKGRKLYFLEKVRFLLTSVCVCVLSSAMARPAAPKSLKKSDLSKKTYFDEKTSRKLYF